MRAARRRMRAADAGEQWQWAAFQLLLYGGESYSKVLRHLTTCVQTLHLVEAAVTVQRGYRQRMGRKMMRTQRQLIEEHRKATAYAQLRAAIAMQSAWRGFFLRTCSRALADEHLAAEQVSRVALH